MNNQARAVVGAVSDAIDVIAFFGVVTVMNLFAAAEVAAAGVDNALSAILLCLGVDWIVGLVMFLLFAWAAFSYVIILTRVLPVFISLYVDLPGDVSRWLQHFLLPQCAFLSPL